MDDLSAPRKQRHTARRISQRLVEEEDAQVGESTVQNLVARLRTEIGANRPPSRGPARRQQPHCLWKGAFHRLNPEQASNSPNNGWVQAVTRTLHGNTDRRCCSLSPSLPAPANPSAHRHRHHCRRTRPPGSLSDLRPTGQRARRGRRRQTRRRQRTQHPTATDPGTPKLLTTSSGPRPLRSSPEAAAAERSVFPSLFTVAGSS
jgi:hypothetical protein